MKNKTYLSILYLSILIFLSASCEKNLDIEPSDYMDGDLALSTDANVKTVLVGAYTVFMEDAIYGGNILRNSELFAADDELSWVGTYNGPREIYNHQIITANDDVTNQWLKSYKCINVCNNILSAMDVVVDEDKNRVEGEALFLRSLMYFDLLRFFANTYDAGQTNSQYGVPLVLTPTHVLGTDNQVGRSTVEEVYAKVITDLERAATLLPQDNGVYASWGAAKALLARVYLQKADYAKARDAASDVIESGLYELNSTYAKAFNNEEYTSEDIFATKFSAADGVNPMTEFWSTTDYGGRDGDIEISEKHLALYSANDQRLALFWNDGYAYRSGKWNTKYGIVNLFRLAEMYLTRAECNSRLGTSIGADPVDDFNMTHTRAGLDAASSVTLQDILLERRLELADEGFRFHDAKRLHQSIGSYAYNDPEMIFPIPAREIEANPALKGQQNPGYE
jgi:starch-binding outer membrane protein, SusD/RagB family